MTHTPTGPCCTPPTITLRRAARHVVDTPTTSVVTATTHAEDTARLTDNNCWACVCTRPSPPCPTIAATVWSHTYVLHSTLSMPCFTSPLQRTCADTIGVSSRLHPIPVMFLDQWFLSAPFQTPRQTVPSTTTQLACATSNFGTAVKTWELLSRTSWASSRRTHASW